MLVPLSILSSGGVDLNCRHEDFQDSDPPSISFERRLAARAGSGRTAVRARLNDPPPPLTAELGPNGLRSHYPAIA